MKETRWEKRTGEEGRAFESIQIGEADEILMADGEGWAFSTTESVD